jgi:hypothetical protein
MCTPASCVSWTVYRRRMDRTPALPQASAAWQHAPARPTHASTGPTETPYHRTGREAAR